MNIDTAQLPTIEKGTLNDEDILRLFAAQGGGKMPMNDKLGNLLDKMTANSNGIDNPAVAYDSSDDDDSDADEEEEEEEESSPEEDNEAAYMSDDLKKKQANE